MKKSVKFFVAVLAIAMMATLNIGALNAQVRSSSGRSGQTRVQQDNRSGGSQVRKDEGNRGGQVHKDNHQVNRDNHQVNKDNHQAHQGGGQISAKDQAKVDRKQGKVDNKQMPAKVDRQPELNHKVDMAKQNHQLQVPYRPERHREIGHGPMMAPVLRHTPAEIRLRTNATTLVVYTEFRTKAEAYAYVSDLMFDRFYDIDTYDTSYGWFRTSMTVIPTPAGWADPRAANQFRIRFDFKRYGAGIKIYITAQWRESMIGGSLFDLRYQPSDRYSTYYAWNILEDIAYSIPHYNVIFQ